MNFILITFASKCENFMFVYILRKELFVCVVYEVSVITGDVKGAGTDAHVFITMHGDRGTTPRVQLINRCLLKI